MPKNYVGNQKGLKGVAVKPVLCYIRMCIFERYSSFKIITRFNLSGLTLQTSLFFTVVPAKQIVMKYYSEKSNVYLASRMLACEWPSVTSWL
jgi:hypothetical protein